MSFTIRMDVSSGQPAESISEYRVQQRGRCTLIFGSLPINDLVALTKKQPKNAMMSTHLAHIAGCDIAFGMNADIDALILALEPEALARGRQLYRTTGLSDDAIRWLSIGHRGSSSNAMFFVLSGVNPGDIDSSLLNAHPGDVGDFYLCRMLLEAVPELVPNLHHIADASHEWAELVRRWSELCDQMDAETPHWRDGRSQSPVTNRLLMEISTRIRAERIRRSMESTPGA